MKESIIKNTTVQNIIKFSTALAFALFTLYQLFLTLLIETSRAGRIIGIVVYLLITLASFFGIVDNVPVRITRLILLMTGLTLLFAVRLLNAPVIFSSLDFNNVPSVLSFSVYILMQFGTLLLIAGYLILRSKIKKETKRKILVIMVSVAVAVYFLILIMESIELVVYHLNIELRLRYTLISRFVYFFAFSSMALSYLLPVPDLEKEDKSGQFVYSEDVDDELDLIL